ncbi:unnamed protein product [Symbiodinium necroappetens]|uniref:Uncharacterized protein n=1 Tax=Symbiodinium necroappetens TaxID=1628268 RepID=A0A812ZGZ5_9DINO|nr:unnamed protein product [Symbiodinium necroappetens]
MTTKALPKAPVPSEPPKMRPEPFAGEASAEGLRMRVARTSRTSCVSHMRSDGSAFSYPFLSVDSLTRLEEVEEGRPEGRSEEEVEATVERWTAYLHPRAKEAIIGCRIWGFEKFSNSSRDFVRGPMVGEGADGPKLED